MQTQFQFVPNPMLSPIQQNYVPIAEDSQELNLQTYMDGYDIAAPGPMIQ